MGQLQQCNGLLLLNTGRPYVLELNMTRGEAFSCITIPQPCKRHALFTQTCPLD